MRQQVDLAAVVFVPIQNVLFFRDDPSFDYVCLMDGNGRPDMMKICWNYFQNCQIKHFWHHEQSLDAMFYAQLRREEILVSTSRWKNVSWSGFTASQVLDAYSRYLGL
jgi:hypothetical protein